MFVMLTKDWKGRPAGEKIDVSQSSPFSFPNFVAQGLVEPLDDMPGAKEYAADFTPFTKQVAMVNGKLIRRPTRGA